MLKALTKNGTLANIDISACVYQSSATIRSYRPMQEKNTRPFLEFIDRISIRTLFLLFMVLLFAAPAFSQRNVYHFSSPTRINKVSSPVNYVYEIPTDSVLNVVFRRSIIDPYVSWLRKPGFIIPAGRIDSLKSTAALLPGYYLVVGVYQNQVTRNIVHKAAINVHIEDIERIKVFSITDDENNLLKTVNVMQESKRVLFDEGMKGYVIKDFFDGDTIAVRSVNDVQYFRCSVTRNTDYERPKRRSETDEVNKENRIYNGYLVTNKPKYLPHDTVKWKAYIQKPNKKNTPVSEELRVYFEDPYYGKTYMISPKFKCAEPGVYFGEFVLGDSLKTDRIYQLRLYGTHSAYRIDQNFKLEDYLLDETKLRVTGEDKKYYQPGDSVNLYAYAFNSNNLPVLDGQINITVTTVNYSTAVKDLLFIPDTLYSATIPVSPDGETNIGFSTKTFPDQLQNFRCLISLTNSNFEKKDTVINISYSSESRYLLVTQTGNKVHAELISNKRSVPGKGNFTARRSDGSGKPVLITYPYDYTIKGNDVYAYFDLTDDTGRVLTTYTHTVAGAAISGIEDFSGDTAILRLYNPSGVLYRYSIYSGNDFAGFGFADGDTLLKIYSPKGKTVSIIGAYTWQGQAQSKRFDIFKMDRDLNITLTKKDFIYPGQQDTISVRLATKDGKTVDRTNVTVFAFNNQFAEDYVPDLPYGGLLYPAYTPRKYHSVSPIGVPGVYAVIADSIWLSRCGADTIFFYKNLYLLPDDIAWVNYDIPNSIMPQLGIYLQQNHYYYQPEIIYVDNRPAYIKQMNSTNPNGIFITEGRHSLRFRMAGMEYSLYNIDICAATKTELYLNIDSIGPFIWKDTVRDSIITYARSNHLSSFTVKRQAPDSLTSSERNDVASYTFMYRNEQRNPNNYYDRYSGYSTAQFFQYPVHLTEGKNMGTRNYGNYYSGNSEYNNLSFYAPINFADSASFFQFNNTKLRFVPERNYIFSFRPQMTRVEKHDIYEHLTYKLRDDQIWPPDSFLTANPPSFDTMPVYYGQPMATYFKSAIAAQDRIRYSLSNSSYDQFNKKEATAKFLVSLTDSVIKYIILHSAKDTESYIMGYNSTVRIIPGKYDVYIVWRDNHYSVYNGIMVAANGTTLLPVNYKTQQGPFDFERPYLWLKKSVISDILNDMQHSFYTIKEVSNDNAAGITGGLFDINNKPVAAITIVVMKNGIGVDSTETDINGLYSFNHLTPDHYNLQFTFQNSRQTITDVPVISGHITNIKNSLRFTISKVNGTYENSRISRIQGTLTDQTGTPIINAVVNVAQGNLPIGSALTDFDGNYTVSPLPVGTYDVTFSYLNLNDVVTGVQVGVDQITTVNNRMNTATSGSSAKDVIVRSTKRYQKPLIDFKAPPHGLVTSDQIEAAPTTQLMDMASLTTQAYQKRNGELLSLGGGRSTGTTVIIDGVMLAAGNASFTESSYSRNQSGDGEVSEKGGKYYLGSPKSQNFLNNFVANMIGASGVRKSFRDWAIWEPNLWTNKEGTATFQVTYPDNMTSWRTYVLAMNRDRYSGKIVQLTRAFKPLSAQLSAPRFLRYGDTVEAIGKVANYTKQAYRLRSTFRQDSITITNDTMTVHNTKVDVLQVAAPTANVIDTTDLSMMYSITTEAGYTDGEEKTIPVYPVGVTESKGIFVLLKGDSTITSKPDSAAGYFTGNSRIHIDGSLLEAMLRDIQKLKVYPHGCNEQLTTMLLSIYYEETIKKLLGDEKFNNTVAKRKILEKLVQAQRQDGSYGWWSNNDADYRITNYIISTMQKINKDGWLDFIIRRGLGNLSNNLDAMSIENQIASMNTLSEGKYAANYKPVLDKIQPWKQSMYNRLAMVKIRKEQGLPYRVELDSLMEMKIETMNGTYWGNTGYDWYRDDIASTLLAYKIVKGDSVYDHLTSSILRYILFKRQYGYYNNTASNGLVLTTILPDLLQEKPASSSKSTYLKMSGNIKDSIYSFPKTYAVKNAQQQFTFEKKGISPVYVSVVYDYFNNRPVAKEDDFSVRTYFLNTANDTVTSLKAGEKITLRTTVTCKKEAEYVMIEVPIPAGCVQATRKNSYYNVEAARENFKDQTDIFCNRLQPKQTYTFDVVLEARYKGRFNISPARAGMMYFPEEYGNTPVKKVLIK